MTNLITLISAVIMLCAGITAIYCDDKHWATFFIIMMFFLCVLQTAINFLGVAIG